MPITGHDLILEPGKGENAKSVRVAYDTRPIGQRGAVASGAARATGRGEVSVGPP